MQPGDFGFEGVDAFGLLGDEHVGVVIVTGAWAELIEVSDDGGRTWSRRPLPAFAKFATLDGTTMWGLAGGDRAGCLYRSTDGAQTWTAHPLFNTPSCPPAS